MKMSVKSIKFAQFCLAGALVAFSFSGSLMAQSADSHKDHKMSMQGHMNMGQEKDNGKDQSIVRKGVIDLKAIDKNKDGKVFQDQMDWNVISDKPGTCPLCKMTLEEVTLKQAKDNLKKNGFKVK
jgi:hypothetical protein